MDKKRRKFLKILLLGAGTFVAGKVFGPFFSKSLSIPSNDKKSSSAFKVVENKKFLSIYDNSGEEVLQIDKST